MYHSYIRIDMFMLLIESYLIYKNSGDASILGHTNLTILIRLISKLYFIIRGKSYRFNNLTTTRIIFVPQTL